MTRRVAGTLACVLLSGVGLVGSVSAAGCSESPRDSPAAGAGGLGAGPALCARAERRCDGPVLEQCNESQRGWLEEQVCASKALCNASEHRCDPPRCQPGQHTCDGRKLQECHAELTHYDDDPDYPEPCAEICDAAEGQCDLCVPEMQICSEDERNLSQCESDGQAYRIVHTCEPDEVCVESPPTAQCSPAGSGGMGGVAGAGG